MNIQYAEKRIGLAVASDSDTRRIAQLRDRHWTMLGISTVVMICAFALKTDASGRVGPTWLPGIVLPELCGSRTLFGVECPGCGLTRSFIALAHGDLAGSLAYNRVGWLLALALLLQFPYRVFGLWELRTGKLYLDVANRQWLVWFGWMLIAALVVNWLSKITGI